MQALTTIPQARGTEVYARLRAQVRDAGIFERSYSFYALLVPFVFVGYALCLYAVYATTNYLWLTAACLGVSFFTAQLGGVMHDAGHRAIFKSEAMNNAVGLTAAFLMAMVFDNWRTRHNAHHAFSNQRDKDPDLEIPFLSIDDAMLDGKSRLQRSLIRYQALYYYPLGGIVSFSNRLGTISYFRRPLHGVDYLRLASYLIGVFVLFVSPFVFFPLEKALFVFFLVHITSGIYLASCFAPNHKGMPVIGEAERMSFIEQQVVTSRNVRGGFFTDLMLVGLNYQVQHHLFPTTPRNKLKDIEPLLQEVCDELDLPFVQRSFIETNQDILRQLRSVQASV